MRRFLSLKHVPAETRRILRDRFRRYLPVLHQPATAPGGVNVISDEQWVNLLLNLDIVSESDVDRARATYDAALPETGGEPSFDQVIAGGWLRVVWGRIAAPFEIDQRTRATSGGNLSALAALLKERFKEKYSFREAVRGSSDLGGLVDEIEHRDKAPDSVRGQTPDWVAARLWDRALASSALQGADVRRWADQWRLLGRPSLVAHKVWSETAADAFRESALVVLETEPGLTGWEDTRAGFIRQISLRTDQPLAVAGQHVPVLPALLFDRARWLNNLWPEGAIAGVVAAHPDFAGLVQLLLTDIEEQESAAAPHPVFKRLMDLAVVRPEILVVVLFRIRSSPALLADLLLYPATAALACWLIAGWQGSWGAWDRELRARDDKTTKAMAFGDAASVLGDFLEKGTFPPADLASLLSVLYRTERFFGEGMADGGSTLTILREEIAGQSTEVQYAIFAALSVAVPQSGLGSAEFAAALDIADAADLTESVDPEPLVSAYVSSVAAGDYWLSANRIGESAAASLVRLAMKTPETLRRSFFAPVDVKSRLAAGNKPGANPYTIEDETARSLRAHIRILCRAVAGLEGFNLKDLNSALIEVVRVGAVKHDEKNRVGAFAARFETDPYRGLGDRPISADLAAALAALADDEREMLLLSILDIDEPVVLAQLIRVVPQEAQARIEARLDQLTPADAAAIRSLPEATARIDALLAADRPDVAAKFIDAERGLRTLGAAPGRDLTRFRFDLHLKLVRGDWSGIAQAEPPPEFSGQTRETALDLVNFFKGLAALRDPNGNPEGAENFFSALHHRHSHVAAYAVNLFAAKISRLLGADGFGALHGASLVRGRQILAEAEQAMVHLRDVSAPDLEIFNCNKALLLLALGQPDRAYGTLASTPPGHLRGSAAAYSAIALNRMGRVREGLAVLDEAQRAIGETTITREAREHIKSGRRFAALVSVTTDDNPIRRIKSALFDLGQLDHYRQAEVLGVELVERSEPFNSLVIDQVRTAAENVISLLTAMNEPKPDFREDDLTGLVRMPLAASVRFLGWTVIDQSPGGFSRKGNAGRRDLVIQKSTTTLAVVEAIACRNPTTHQSVKGDLTGHFQKLLGYSPCALFFHLTYSYVDEPSKVLDHLKQVAETEAPPGFTYKGNVKDIPLRDSRPTGFIVEYRGPLGGVTVVFLVLDMRQHAQREAARLAGDK
jgi:hypothetical protein